jgi:hypothetical protein
MAKKAKKRLQIDLNKGLEKGRKRLSKITWPSIWKSILVTKELMEFIEVLLNLL